MLRVLVVLLLLAGSAIAAPSLMVRGKVQVQILDVERRHGLSVIRGHLRDATMRTPLSHRRVRLAIEIAGRRMSRTVRTNKAGKFAVTLAAPPGTYSISLTFPGDTLYAPLRLPTQPIDISKSTLHLELEVEPTLDAARPQQQLTVRARVGSLAATVPVDLEANGKRIARAPTDGRGIARISIPTSALGRPGAIRFAARFAGDKDLNAARREAESILLSPVTITLEKERDQVKAEGQIHLRGRVSDLSGPISGATVSVQAMGRHAASALTDSAGRFVFALSAGEFPPGSLDLSARYTPAVIWRKAATSKPVMVEILPPKPIPVQLYAIPAALTAAILVALLLVRFRHSFLLLRGKSSRATESKAAIQKPFVSGLRQSRTRRILKQDYGLSGVVWDPCDDRPITGAVVLIDTPGTAIELRCDERGSFSYGGLPEGSHRVTVTCIGYVAERFDALFPHRGQLQGIRVDMVPVRVRLLEIYRDVALPLLPKEALWARWTPRELLRYLERKVELRTEPLRALSLLLEEAYWSAETTDEAALAEAKMLVEELSASSR